MAICLRRAITSKSSLFLSISMVGARGLSGFSPITGVTSQRSIQVPGPDFRFQSRSDDLFGADFSAFISHSRGFAKGRKQKKEEEEDRVQVAPNIGPTVKSAATSQMDTAILSLSRELSKLRTGRASAGMLDHIIVVIGDVKVPLNRVAVVSVIDSRTLSVTPYDPTSIKAVEHAVISSPFGINPKTDGQRLIAPIPPLTKENIQALCKLVTKSAEDIKQSIRRARQKALDMIKKASSSIPKDDVKRLEKEVEDITKRFIKSADDMCKAKEKEISGS